MKTHISNSVYAVSNCGVTSVGNPSTGIVYFDIDTNILATRSQVTTDINAATFTALRLADTNGAVTALGRNTGGGLMWGLQDVSGELNKVTALVDGVSGISLGTGTGADQRIACYESGSNYFMVLD